MFKEESRKMPLASTFMDEDAMDGCKRENGMVWEFTLTMPPIMTYVKNISMSETIGVTRKDDVWCWACVLMVVAEVVWDKQHMCVHKNTLSLLVYMY